VFPAAAARAAWLELGTERYDEALWYLLWQGALVAADSIAAVLLGRPFGYSSYLLAEAVIRMLEWG
jgi:hypothetical protein